jgi:hypothetical protein
VLKAIIPPTVESRSTIVTSSLARASGEARRARRATRASAGFAPTDSRKRSQPFHRSASPLVGVLV